ncbi:DUF3352 domain-containing protein [Carboxylicivirga mesophila]|uniref:DUF3352 domain-containing protein n=1 Tax=Carboxylicivirga mesophila TaxID=1166478 RepID=A0ABS5KF34_9BACT|nr:DUF3352 domain-containing protein [Carboxylicivirga mesophila]MBS2213068.1 DUF3352 domain-containing protein [Carboxylicivirga mesophila]
MKKGWVVATIAISCLLLGYILYQVSRVKSYDNTQSLVAVPADAAVIIKAENADCIYNALFNTIDYKEELQNSQVLNNAFKQILALDSITFENGVNVYQEINGLPVYYSFHAQGKESVSQLFVFELPNKREESKIARLIKQLTELGANVSVRKYNSQSIYKITANKQEWFANIDNGILLLSQSSLLIETSIRQQQSPDSWVNGADFKQIYKTIGAGSKLNVFINFPRLPDVMKPILGDAFQKNAKIVGDQSKWAEFDVEISNQAIVLNGFMSASNTGVISKMLENARPQRTQIQYVLPSNTRAYLSYSLESASDMRKRITGLHNANVDYQRKLEQWQKKYGFNPEEELFSQLTGRLALVYSDYNNLQPEANGLLVLKLKSQSSGKEMLLEMLRKMSSTSSSSMVVKTYQPDNGVSYPVYHGFEEGVLAHFFDPLLPKVPYKYLAFYDDNLVVADAPVLLEQFIYNNMLKKTLGNDKAHQQFLSNFSSRENVFAFCETAHLAAYFGETFQPLLGQLNEAQKEAFNNFYGIGMQLSGTGKMIYTTSYLQYMPSRESEPRTVWQSLLDSTVSFKPVLVDNHYTREKEVIVQDDAHNLYLLSNTGRVLWKKPLDSEILGDVIQIDYYRNNKLQYLFNTRKSIYLLDRNGNHVANFPVRLPSDATNGMAVFDYDNNRNYRFFIACENRHIYLYNNKGNTVSGWKFDKTDGRVIMPVQHFRSNGKDYIAFADDKRNYICDRKGNIRVKLNKQFARNRYSSYYLCNQNQADDCLVTTNSDGLLTKIKLSSGEVKTSALKTIKETHAFSAFEHNGKLHYQLVEPHCVTCFTSDGKEVLKKEFDNEINLNVDLYRFSAQNIKLGVSEKVNGHIHLLNADGRTYKGFPLKGNSRFSIGFLKSSASRFNLIVGGADNYIYNYQVD